MCDKYKFYSTCIIVISYVLSILKCYNNNYSIDVVYIFKKRSICIVLVSLNLGSSNSGCWKFHYCSKLKLKTIYYSLNYTHSLNNKFPNVFVHNIQSMMEQLTL